MKLLVVSSWLPYPLDNGSRVRAYHLLRHLSRRHTLTLLAFGLPDGGEQLAPLHALCRDVAIVPPIAIDRHHLGWRGLLSGVPRHLVQNESAAMRALVSRHIPGQTAAVALQIDAARYLLDSPAVPRVFEEVEVTVLREQYRSEPRALRKARHGMTWWKFRRYIRRLVHGFERSTVVSEREREHLRVMGCDIRRVAVVPNGVEIAHPPRGEFRTRALRLIYPGSITYFANFDAVRYFIKEILPLVRRVLPDVEFWVTGSTGDIDVSDLRVPGVTFTGRLPEVDSVVAESAACVVPLRIGGGTRLKILQAMACSTPVVSTSKGIEGLEIEPDRHVLVADSPDAFAAAVLRLLSDAPLGRRIARSAERCVRERYAWPHIGTTLERVLDDAIAEHRYQSMRSA